MQLTIILQDIFENSLLIARAIWVSAVWKNFQILSNVNPYSQNKRGVPLKITLMNWLIKYLTR